MTGIQKWEGPDIRYVIARRKEGAAWQKIAEEMIDANPQVHRELTDQKVKYAWGKFKDHPEYNSSVPGNLRQLSKRKAPGDGVYDNAVDATQMAEAAATANMTLSKGPSALMSTFESGEHLSPMTGQQLYQSSLQQSTGIHRNPPTFHLDKSPRMDMQLPVRYSTSPRRDSNESTPSIVCPSLRSANREQSTSSSPLQKTPTQFQPPTSSLRVPDAFYTDLESGIYRAAYVVDTGDRILIFWFIMPSTSVVTRHTYFDFDVSSQFDFRTVKGCRLVANGPHVTQFVVNAQRIPLFWDVDGQENAKNLALVLEQAEKDSQIGTDAFWLELKKQVDKRFNFNASTTSIWGKPMNRASFIFLAYNFFDGTPHSAHLIYEELDSKRGGMSFVSHRGGGNVGPQKFSELEVPEFVNEAVSIRLFGFHEPALLDPFKSQVLALKKMANDLLHANNWRGALWNTATMGSHYHHPFWLANTEVSHKFRHPNKEIRLAQLLFLLNWRLRVAQFNRIPGFQYCSHPGMYMCPMEEAPCISLAKRLESYETYMVHEIYFRVLKWVLEMVGNGCFENLNNPNNRNERMMMWFGQVPTSILPHIFDVLFPGIQFTDLIRNTKWVHYLKTSMIRLADTIFLYQICQKPLAPSLENPNPSNIRQFSPVIVDCFFMILRGCDLARNSIINPSCPPPVCKETSDEIDLGLIKVTQTCLETIDLYDVSTWNNGELVSKVGWGLVPSGLLDDDFGRPDEGCNYVVEVKCEAGKVLPEQS